MHVAEKAATLDMVEDQHCKQPIATERQVSKQKYHRPQHANHCLWETFKKLCVKVDSQKIFFFLVSVTIGC